MKLKSALFLAVLSLLAFSGCGIITPLSKTTYAELRLDDDGKRQLLIESDQWMGVAPPDGPGGNRHFMEYSFLLQGDGPVYELKLKTPEWGGDIGSITIDQERKTVTIDTKIVPSAEVVRSGDPNRVLVTIPNRYNGTYRLASINHDPFYISGQQYKPMSQP